MEAKRHVASCADCSRKVAIYSQLVRRSSNAAVPEPEPPGADCPNVVKGDWREVAAGRWPEIQARQLILHAARCGHCGPLLRDAASAPHQLDPEEERALAEQRVVSSRLDRQHSSVRHRPFRNFMTCLIPAASLVAVAMMLDTRPSPSMTPISGPKFAEFAVNTEKQYTQGALPLDIRADSQHALNDWLKANSRFFLALPDSPVALGEERPYRLEGARLVQLGGKDAAFISYQVWTSASLTTDASLVVTPDTVAAASGGVEANFKKVNFYYLWIERYRVVTWSQHGLTYALVSQEGNGSQRSCMVCHSAMRDRDLSQTPTPLPAEAVDPVLQ